MLFLHFIFALLFFSLHCEGQCCPCDRDQWSDIVNVNKRAKWVWSRRKISM